MLFLGGAPAFLFLLSWAWAERKSTQAKRALYLTYSNKVIYLFTDFYDVRKSML